MPSSLKAPYIIGVIIIITTIIIISSSSSRGSALVVFAVVVMVFLCDDQALDNGTQERTSGGFTLDCVGWKWFKSSQWSGPEAL